jgi:hypothetical protein
VSELGEAAVRLRDAPGWLRADDVVAQQRPILYQVRCAAGTLCSTTSE